MAKTLLLVGGHGAGDSGATGNGTIEANETRRVNQALYNRLNGKIPVEIYNIGKDLYRTNDHAAYRNHEIIETHFNAFNGNARGTEVLIKTGFSADALDNSLLSAMAKYFTNRGIKQRSDLSNMNKFASMGTSYRLIEVCFIDSADMTVYNGNFDSLITDMANAIIKMYGVSPEAPVPPSQSQSGMYRVRKSWADAKSQIGAYKDQDNAKKVCKEGYSVFDDVGNIVYQAQSAKVYQVRVVADVLNIRSGPGTSCQVTGTIKDRGIYTIVETQGDWGKLKSGAGWICLQMGGDMYAKRI